jgi:REP element-mobilizing transposase RayT
MGTLDYQHSYRRNLPHLQPPGATFFVTSRLAGSLPQEVIDQWTRERQWLGSLEQTNPMHHERVKSDFERAWFAKFERLLDRAKSGPVWLKNKQVAEQVAQSLHYRDRRVYRLDAFSIMPNHVHVVFKPLAVTQAVSLRRQSNKTPVSMELDSGIVPQADSLRYHSLASIMQSLKGYTAFQANKVLGREGEFWVHESYDHCIRSADEWRRIVAYVLNNPVKAGYVEHWQAWKWSYRRV